MRSYNISPGIAFFDVDETLINTKSMFDFLRYYLRKKRKYTGSLTYNVIWKMTKYLSWLGVNRITINALYYRLYKGINYQELMQCGELWYLEKKRDRTFLLAPVITRLLSMKHQGYDIVFVSGSFKPCLTPLAMELGVKKILCTELEILNDVISGKLQQQAIGKHKAMLVQQYINSKKVNKDHCYAFGDHISDLPMLELVGNPVVIPRCKELINIAKTKHWKLINCEGYL